MGPWYHGQAIQDGSSLGALKFNSDTALYFRREILRPFLDHYLKDDAPRLDVAPVTAFETGTNTWRRLPAWPAGCASGCTVHADAALSRRRPEAELQRAERRVTRRSRSTSRIRPSPCRSARVPIRPTGYAEELTWWRWLVDDQREASGRPDVVSFVSDVLTAPVKISGQPVANLVASTSGTDCDWVVKLIDVYPDEVAGPAADGRLSAGHGLMPTSSAAAIARASRRPRPIEAGKAAAVSLRAADGEPRVPAGPPDHGAGAVELVPALRPQPADLRAEHLLGEARRLPQGRAARSSTRPARRASSSCRW